MIRLLNLAMVIGLLPELLKESKMVITLLDSKRLEKMENFSLERHPICVMNLHLGLNTLWNVRQKENMKIQQFSVLVLSIKNLLTDVHQEEVNGEVKTSPKFFGTFRSEERRVGEECRSRWWQNH